MPTLTLLLHENAHRLDFEPGRSLRAILDASDFRVRSACLGIGACGLCRVKLMAGEGGEIMPAERLQLGDAITAGLRLACQFRPSGDATVDLLNPAPPSAWRTPPSGLVNVDALPRSTDRPLPAGIEHPLGVAVDLGTSHLTIAICDLASGRPLALRFGHNPQHRFGADVVTRLMAAEDPAVAGELAFAARQAIGTALTDMAEREGLDPRRIGRVVIVGNTAMLALLTDHNHGLLLQPAHWSAPLDCSPLDSGNWSESWGIAPTARIEVVQPLSGFVGSDLLAGLVASGLVNGSAPALLVDFGTNSEIALWTGRKLWVTAAAGGPAFESGAGCCGMPAEAGAIYRVEFDAHGQPVSRILGADRARGLCGSGLVDLVAGLRRLNILTAAGKFTNGHKSFQLPVDDRALSLDGHDVDALQRAKGAIGAGISVLCAAAGVAVPELQRVVAAGLFGRYLNVANAQAIGLLPTIPAERIELAGNTALAGAVALLLSRAAGAAVENARLDAACVNLALAAGFDDAFLEHLYLHPITR